MDIEHSCTAVATSDIAAQVKSVIEEQWQKLGNSGSNQIIEVQLKIEELRKKGFLKRQSYAAAKNADFQRIFFK
ncbi:MAG: hypothetical protein ACLQVY_12900 [Limisphaerales bacterium]